MSQKSPVWILIETFLLSGNYFREITQRVSGVVKKCDFWNTEPVYCFTSLLKDVSCIEQRKQFCGLIPFRCTLNDSATSQNWYVSPLTGSATARKVDWKKHEMLSVIIKLARRPLQMVVAGIPEIRQASCQVRSRL